MTDQPPSTAPAAPHKRGADGSLGQARGRRLGSDEQQMLKLSGPERQGSFRGRALPDAFVPPTDLTAADSSSGEFDLDSAECAAICEAALSHLATEEGAHMGDEAPMVSFDAFELMEVLGPAEFGDPTASPPPPQSRSGRTSCTPGLESMCLGFRVDAQAKLYAVYEPSTSCSRDGAPSPIAEAGDDHPSSEPLHSVDPSPSGGDLEAAAPHRSPSGSGDLNHNQSCNGHSTSGSSSPPSPRPSSRPSSPASRASSAASVDTATDLPLNTLATVRMHAMAAAKANAEAAERSVRLPTEHRLSQPQPNVPLHHALPQHAETLPGPCNLSSLTAPVAATAASPDRKSVV